MGGQLQTIEKIREFVQVNLETDEDVKLADEDNLFETRYVNSLFAMKVVSFVENDFKIVINENDLDINNFSSINKIDYFVRSKLNL